MIRLVPKVPVLPFLAACALAVAVQSEAQSEVHSEAQSEAQSRTVTLRSGDHPGYARLVLDFPGPRPPWRLGRAGQVYLLDLDAGDVRIDTSGVYRLIGRDRITGVAQNELGGPLAIDLGCDCHADAFEFGDASIVIDIRDGPPPPGSAFETGLPAPLGPGNSDDADQVEWDQDNGDPGQIAMPLPGSDLSAAPVAGAILPFEWQDGPRAELRARPGGPEIGSRQELGRALQETEGEVPGPTRPLSVDDILTARQAEALAPPVFPKTEPDSRAVEAIARQLGRASSQGLIEVPVAQPVPEDGQAPAAPNAADAPSAGRGNMRILTSIDRDFAAAGLDRPVPHSNPFCLPDRDVAVGLWGNEARIGADIGAFRAAILDGRDRPDDRAILALARHYLFLTFGAEVRALLGAFPGTVPDAPVLLALAEVMDGTIDGRPIVPDGPLFGQAGCATQVALWAFLASPDPAAEAPATAAIVATYTGLPLHLRRHIAPRLAQAFEQTGDADAARAVLFAVTRAPGHHGDAVALAAAKLEGDGALDALLAGDPPQAAEAALTILEREIATGGPVDEAAISAAAAFAFEFRDLPSGPPLKAAEIRGLIANGEFRPALLVLQDATREALIDDAAARTLAAELLHKAATKADDVDFITITVALGPRIRPDAPAREARIAAAARLFDLGLDSLAQGLARPADTDAPQLRLARARRALALGSPPLALSWLSGLEIPEARLLEAEALSAAGRHRDAADAFGRLGDSDRSEAEALRARDWARLSTAPAASPGPPFFGGDAGTALPPAVADAAAEPSRSPNDLLLQAEVLREGIEGLLGRVSR